MQFTWPWILTLLGVIPLLALAYLWMLRRRRRYAVRYSSLSLLRAAIPKSSPWKRHLPFILFLLAAAGLIVAAGRPVAVVRVPSGQANILLAIDVSRSMCSVDIAPNRLETAKDAAISFVRQQRSTTSIGIVAFAGFAQLVQPSTMDQEMLIAAIENLSTGRRTAIGSAIVAALEAIAEVDPNVAPLVPAGDPTLEPAPLPPGVYVPNIIVLLTDGASNSGIDPLAAAQLAADRGVRVYTIGYGTEDGGTMDCNPFDSVSGDAERFGGGFGNGFGGGGGGGGFGNFRRGIDEEALRQVSALTGGDYYAPTSAGELNDVFAGLPTYLITKQETTEISVFFAAGGALLALLAVVFSMLWNPVR